MSVEDGAKVVESAFREADVRLEWFSGTGAGGQHRNKHQNSVRAIHEPTGIVAKAECRSKPESLLYAMREIEARVTAAARKESDVLARNEKREQVGSGMRGDKVRTYRLQDDTVTDHRTDRRTTWKKVSRGDFSALA